MTGRSIIRQAILALPLIAISPGVSPAQEVLRAPRPSLIDVTLPDLGNLEAAVAEQIRSVHQSAAAAIATPNASTRALAEAYSGLAQLHHSYELYQSASASYKNAKTLAPADYRWPYLLGQVATSTGDLEAAVGYYGTAASLNESFVPLWVNFGRVFLALNRLDDAAAALQNALSLAPASVAALAASGEVELRQRRYPQAIKKFTAALAGVPRANRLHYSLAMAYRGMRDMERARLHVKQSGKVGVRPNDPLLDEIRKMRVGARVFKLEGKMAFDAGRYDSATRLFSKAVEADATDAAALGNLGSALAQWGDIDGAIQRFQAALKLDPQSPTSRFNLGVLLAKSGDHSSAAENLAIHLETEQRDPEARRALAGSYSALGRFAEAETEFRRVLEIAPADERSLIDLANLLVRANRYAETVALLEAALDKFPGRPRTMNALGRILSSAPNKSVRNGARALELARSAFETQGTVAHGQTLAESLAELGRCDEAALMQAKLVVAATRADDAEMANDLGRALERYRTTRPCAAK